MCHGGILACGGKSSVDDSPDQFQWLSRSVRVSIWPLDFLKHIQTFNIECIKLYHFSRALATCTSRFYTEYHQATIKASTHSMTLKVTTTDQFRSISAFHSRKLVTLLRSIKPVINRYRRLSESCLYEGPSSPPIYVRDVIQPGTPASGLSSASWQCDNGGRTTEDNHRMKGMS